MLMSESEKELVSRTLTPLLKNEHYRPLTKEEKLALKAAIFSLNGNYEQAKEMSEALKFLDRHKH
jgi:hypothetical protein